MLHAIYGIWVDAVQLKVRLVGKVVVQDQLGRRVPRAREPRRQRVVFLRSDLIATHHLRANDDLTERAFPRRDFLGFPGGPQILYESLEPLPSLLPSFTKEGSEEGRRW